MSKSFRQSFASELRACYCCFKTMNQGLEGHSGIIQQRPQLVQAQDAGLGRQALHTTTHFHNGGNSSIVKMRNLEDRCRPQTIT